MLLLPVLYLWEISMFRDHEIKILVDKLNNIEKAQAMLQFNVEESEFKSRMKRLLKQEVNETLMKLESVLIKSIS